MRIGVCGFATVQLDACRNLIRVGDSIAKRGVHLRSGENRICDERRDGISLSLQVLHPHDDLPNVGATKQPRAPSSWAVTKGDERMFVAAGALLGIAAKSIGEGLTGGACPQAKAFRKRIVKAYGNVDRHGIQRSTMYAAMGALISTFTAMAV
jgi:hypothetical protein